MSLRVEFVLEPETGSGIKDKLNRLSNKTVLLVMKIILLLVLCVGIICCSPRTFDPIPHDPIGDIWKDWADGIADLKRPGTPKSAWDEKASTGRADEITNENDLRNIISCYELSGEETTRYVTLYSHAGKIMHYGFEGDFRALVFFDQNERTIDAFLMGN